MYEIGDFKEKDKSSYFQKLTICGSLFDWQTSLSLHESAGGSIAFIRSTGINI